MFRVALLSLLLFLACGQEDVFTVTLPCVPVEGSELDPCEDSHPGLRSSLGASEPSPLPEAPAPIANFFGDGDSIAATHLIVRATHLPNTTRCTASNPFRVADHQEGVLTGVGAPGYHCYIDARVNEFYVGSGPSQMTLMIWRFEYYREPHNEEFRQAMEMGLGAALEGREYVLFLGPSFDVSTEVWQIFGVWKVGLKPDSSVVAIHPKRDRWLAENPAGTTQHASALEMTLPTLSAALTAAHTERMQRFGGRIGAGTDLPMLQTSAVISGPTTKRWERTTRGSPSQHSRLRAAPSVQRGKRLLRRPKTARPSRRPRCFLRLPLRSFLHRNRHPLLRATWGRHARLLLRGSPQTPTSLRTLW